MNLISLLDQVLYVFQLKLKCNFSALRCSRFSDAVRTFKQNIENFIGGQKPILLVADFNFCKINDKLAVSTKTWNFLGP